MKYSYKTIKNAIKFGVDPIDVNRPALFRLANGEYHVANSYYGYAHHRYYLMGCEFIEFLDGDERVTSNGHLLVPVAAGFAEDPKLAFVCLVQDVETLYDIQEAIGDKEITAAAFGTETGDYSPLYVRYFQPSFRSGGQWYEVK